jgi:hypothetical protein
MKEQITEKFAKELIMFSSRVGNDELTLNRWKSKGYIKQSREDQIRSLLITTTNFEERCYYMEELIEILDNKLKGGECHEL